MRLVNHVAIRTGKRGLPYSGMDLCPEKPGGWAVFAVDPCDGRMPYVHGLEDPLLSAIFTRTSSHGGDEAIWDS